MQMITYVGIISFAVVGTAILTRAMMTYAIHRCIVDVPNERSSHAAPTPRGGGLAMVVVFCAGLMFLWARDDLAVRLVLAIGGSSLIAAGVGFCDDHGHVSARVRVSFHCAAAF